MIAQAWAKHDRLRTLRGPRRIHHTLVAEHEAEMRSFVTDEIFVRPLNLAHSSYALAENNEVFENAQVSEISAVSKNFQFAQKAKPSKNVKHSQNVKQFPNVKQFLNVKASKYDNNKPFLTEV